MHKHLRRHTYCGMNYLIKAGTLTTMCAYECVWGWLEKTPGSPNNLCAGWEEQVILPESSTPTALRNYMCVGRENFSFLAPHTLISLSSLTF